MQWTLLCRRLLSLLLIISPVDLAFAKAPAPFSSKEIKGLQANLLANMATAHHVFHKTTDAGVITSQPGAVLAAAPLSIPHFSQDYTFHWMRDAALTMQTVVQLALPKYDDLLISYMAFEVNAQRQPSLPGEATLGQPKFNMDGTVWEGAWARPQNDGPALRAITFMQIGHYFATKERKKWSDDVPLTAVMNDLDYVCNTWQSPTYDLWEEVEDTDHFYTKMVQRKSLLMGADLMRALDRPADALRYEQVANAITQSLAAHWQERLGAYTETLHHLDQKGGGLDSSVLLGVLHGRMNDDEGPYTVSDVEVMSTVANLKRAFAELYPINAGSTLTPLMGRYPSDIYDGDQFVRGNPWVLITNALAEYDYRLAAAYLKKGAITITPLNVTFFQQISPSLSFKPAVLTRASREYLTIIDSLIANGDALLARVKQFQQTYPEGGREHYAEQLDRNTGEPASAPDLSWGYASFLSALQAREVVVAIKRYGEV